MRLRDGRTVERGRAVGESARPRPAGATVTFQGGTDLFGGFEGGAGALSVGDLRAGGHTGTSLPYG